MWREADALTELSASGGYSRDAILPQRMFTPCGEDPQGRCNLLRRATSLARYAYLSGMRAMRPAVFRVTNRRLEPVSLPGKVLPVPGTAWTLLLSRRKPWQRRSLLLREFLGPTLPPWGFWALSMCDMLINPDLEATPSRSTFTV